MKRFLAMVAILGLVAMPALAERIVLEPHQIQLRGVTGATMGSLESVGGANGVTGMTVNMSGVTARTIGGTDHLYDNWPTFLGGVGTTGGGSFAFVDWTSTSANWTDYMNLSAAGTLRHITYAYIGTAGGLPGGAATHTIRLHTGAVPPPLGVSGPFVGVGAAVATIVLPSMPGTLAGGFVSVVAFFPGVTVATTGLYVGFDEGPDTLGNLDSVFWLSGGSPGIGTNTVDFIYWLPAVPYSYNLPGLLTTYFGANDNITMALGSVPEPATIALLSVGGLLALRRRRAA